MLIDFVWQVDVGGYELVDRRKDAFKGYLPDGEGNLRRPDGLFWKPRAGEGFYLRAKTEKWRATEPIRHDPRLYERFANLEGNPQRCVDFANAWGLLGVGEWVSSEFSYGDRATPPIEEHLADWFYQAESLRGTILAANRMGAAFIDAVKGYTSASLQLVVRRRASDGRPVAAYRPSSLLNAINAQFAWRLISPEEGPKVCECCGEWFSPKRSDARFCTARCKIRFHRGQCAPLRIADAGAGTQPPMVVLDTSRLTGVPPRGQSTKMLRKPPRQTKEKRK